jgi:hypothetical protein
MKKKLLIIGGSVLAAGVIFSAGLFTSGTLTGASSDWQTTEFADANLALGQKGYQVKEELKASAPADINAKIDTEITQTVEQQKAELEALLEQYYQMKIDGLVDSPEYIALQGKIEGLKTEIFNRYKIEIDKAFTTTTP